MKHAMLALALVALSALARAQADSPDILAANNLVLMQFMSTNVDYRESGNGFLGTRTGLLDTETGNVAGVALSASSMKGADNLYWQVYFDYSSGQTRYTGALQGGSFGSYVGFSSAALMNYGARIGQGFSVTERSMLTPYLELGRHEWDRGVNYGEEYTHFYYGVGVMGQYSPQNALVLSVTALYGKTAGPYIAVSSGPLVNGFSGALGTSVLYKAGVALDYAFSPAVHGNLSADYMGFRYGMSSAYPVGTNLVAWEPDSKTRYLTLKLGLGTTF